MKKVSLSWVSKMKQDTERNLPLIINSSIKDTIIHILTCKCINFHS